MNNAATQEKMRFLKLLGMEHAYKTLLESSHDRSLTNDEVIAHLVEAEWEERQNRKTKRLIRMAGFRNRAPVQEVDFTIERGLNKNEFLRLADCRWISEGRSMIISGPTGVGKSYLAQSLGNQACVLGFTTAYFNCSKLFPLLKQKRTEGSYHRIVNRIAKASLLVMDDFGLLPLDAQDRLSLLELIEDRYGRAGTIIASQIPVAQWFDVIGDPTIADAVCDRLVPQAIRLNLSGKSLRTNQTVPDNSSA